MEQLTPEQTLCIVQNCITMMTFTQILANEKCRPTVLADKDPYIEKQNIEAYLKASKLVTSLAPDCLQLLNASEEVKELYKR